MPDHIRQAIVSLEQEIEALDQRRGELQRAIDTMRPLAGEGTSRRKGKKALKRNERTNERTSKARANRDAQTEPP